MIIDPVDEQLERDMAALREHGLRAGVVGRNACPCGPHHQRRVSWPSTPAARTAAPEGCGIGTAAVQLKHGDVLRFGGEQLKALHTPGHTAGSMSYLWRDHVFTGDTLLINGCGRTDFQSGSAAALYRSLTEVLFRLPDETVVWPGHDYQGRSHSTIGAEKAGNARVAGKTLAEFKAIMDELQPAQTQTPGRGRAREPRARACATTRGGGPVRAAAAAADGLCRRRRRHSWPANGGKRATRSWWTCAAMPSANGSASCPAPCRWPGSSGPGMALNDGLRRRHQGGGSAGQEGGAVLPQRRALDCRCQAGHRAWHRGLQRPGRLRGRPRRERASADSAGGWRFRGLPWRQG